MANKTQVKSFEKQYPGSDRFIYLEQADAFIPKSTRPVDTWKNRDLIEQYNVSHTAINAAWQSWKKATTLKDNFIGKVQEHCGVSDEQMIYLQAILEDYGLVIEEGV